MWEVWLGPALGPTQTLGGRCLGPDWLWVTEGAGICDLPSPALPYAASSKLDSSPVLSSGNKAKPEDHRSRPGRPAVSPGQRPQPRMLVWGMGWGLGPQSPPGGPGWALCDLVPRG